MADTGILCTQTDVQYKAGAGASSTATAEAYTNAFIHMAEGVICATTRYNWCDVYSTLNSDVKGILRDVASSLAAMYCIQYDMGGFNSRVEAETQLDVLRDSVMRGLKLLESQEVKSFITGA